MSADRSMRLAMSLLVRDEAGLIADNIAFHSRMGVDCFVITDNGSVDGAREILDALCDDYDITLIDEPEHTMRQDVWVNRMASIAAERLGADWIINSDADEFWAPSGDSLKAVIPNDADVLLCRRSNMLGLRGVVESPGYSFQQNNLRVVRPFDNTEFHRPPWKLSERPVTMSEIGPKVMCRLNGLQSIGYGNHEAVHAGRAVEASAIHVYHYPVRTFAEFLSKVMNHGTSLENNPALPPTIGWHVRRWYALYQQGLIEEEFSRLVLDETAASAYLQAGVLEQDDSMKKRLNP
jgi:hypothetical protein